ncbi:complement C1q tumor necrosis factor-related protein 3-like [Mercenaria mercenaria]|uniref:complement C1q tumor necrosis factor-related protein 3-like n=1 Tax=Mercenaria mercenaria TaxID=6596 RepID=UPI00234F9467|nr:complement C1q tumor necrosis factor-related protein 3-like [Mercenaria mercenaria]XP_053400813.1 complement C1q tumor necrosis factor-related protein 3-like [Mercenaria mercenaria]
MILDSLRTNNDKLKQSVDIMEQQNKSKEHFLKQIVHAGEVEVNENMTKNNVRKNIQQQTGDQNTMRVARQEREQVAFSAYLKHDLSNLGPGHTIQYGATVLNEGNAFNVNTGIFTVPVSGVYLFSFACEDYRNHRIYADILVDGTRKSLVLEGPVANAHSMGTNVVILRLTKGQAVWVAIDAGGNDDLLQNSATTFSGAFLYH